MDDCCDGTPSCREHSESEYDRQVREGRMRETVTSTNTPTTFRVLNASQVLAQMLDKRRHEAQPAAPETFEATFKEIFAEAFELLVDRQRKYGPENVRKLGTYGLFTRIEDKMERLRHAFNGEIVKGVFNVTEKDEASDESLDDGDLDAANYHLIRVALRRGVWGRPLEKS